MFIKVFRKSTLRKVLLLVLICAAGVFLLSRPRAAATGVSRGLSICTDVIIPSLFPLLVLSGFLVNSGLSAAIGRKLTRLTRFLFGLPGSCAAAILVSFVGGYPAGGLAVGELVRKGEITRDEGRRMLRFCVNGGPAFIISAVGAGMLGSVQFGCILYAAHILSSLIIGIGGRFADKRASKKKPAEPLPAIREERMSVPSAFVYSVNHACRSLLYMCGFIVLFASLLSLADATGFSRIIAQILAKPLVLLGADPRAASSVFPCLLEVSCGCVEAAQCGPLAPVTLGLALGWGGLSVHCQIASMLSGQKLITRSFFAARLLQGLLGALISLLLYHYIPLPAIVSASRDTLIMQPVQGSVLSAVALLVVCSMLLIVTNHRGKVRINLEKRS